MPAQADDSASLAARVPSFAAAARAHGRLALREPAALERDAD